MEAHGRIVLVQEDRFLLEEENGHKQLFLVGHNLSFNPEDLRALARTQDRIAVHYDTPAHLLAAVASRIWLAEPV